MCTQVLPSPKVHIFLLSRYEILNTTDFSSDGLINDVEDGRAHLAVSELAITYDRYKMVDFTYPHNVEGDTIVSPGPSVSTIPFGILQPFSALVRARRTPSCLLLESHTEKICTLIGATLCHCAELPQRIYLLTISIYFSIFSSLPFSW